MDVLSTIRPEEQAAANADPRYPELRGRVALVTGAARGIGRGIALRLAREGMRIVAVDIDAEALTETVRVLEGMGATARGFVGNVGVADEVDRLFDEGLAPFQQVDVLVNNAASLRRSRLLDDKNGLLELQLASNVAGPYRCSQRAAALMKEVGAGSIIHISSVGAVRAHHRGLPYDVTKGAINSMTRAMAVDLGPYGIRVNAIGPGLTHTYRTDPSSDSYTAAAARVPLGRFGTPSDIAAAVAFLASAEASYITGQVLYVDGGLVIQLDPPPAADSAGSSAGRAGPRTEKGEATHA